MISWVLLYPDGTRHVPLDPPKGIKHAKDGAEHLVLTANDAPMFAIPLEGQKPIFCELRAIEQGPDARPGPFHVVYVFGYGTKEKQYLWTLEDGKAIPCPPEISKMAEGGILNCVGAL